MTDQATATQPTDSSEEVKAKIKSIENSPEKNAVRTAILGQVEQYVDHLEASEITLVSLPAEHWFFEAMLKEKLKAHDCRLRVFAAETDMKICIPAIKKMPPDCAIGNCDFDTLLSTPMYQT